MYEFNPDDVNMDWDEDSANSTSYMDMSYTDADCIPSDLLRILINLLGQDSDTVKQFLKKNCSGDENATTSPVWSWEIPASHKEDLRMLSACKHFYAYVTPFIIIVGLLGNIMSMKIFSCRRMRKVSASFYLTALAASDSLVLVTYVLLDWLPRGLKLWPGANSVNISAIPGMCQAFLFLAYIFRFMSAWLIVVFTVERFIGVCHPLHRRAWCTESFAKRAIIGIVVFGSILSSYKPALSGIVHYGNATICARKTEYVMLNFTLDGLYACSITALPFGIILLLNCLIIKRLNETKQRHRRTKFSVDESSIKLEFTAILLMISTTFVVLNLPYFILWCVNFHRQLNNWLSITNPTDAERMRGWMYIAKTIFFGNYCVNFFLYSMTGAYFRRQLLCLVCQDSACGSYYAASGASNASGTHHPQCLPMTSRVPLASGLQTDLLQDVRRVPETSRKVSWINNNYN